MSVLVSLSADGQTGSMITNNVAKKTGGDISILDVATGKPRCLLETPFMELGAALTSDAR